MRTDSLSSKASHADLDRKITWSVILLCLVFTALLAHFWRLQVSQREKYRVLADNNRIRLVEMPATRGIITDRNGVILADSTPLYDLVVVPEDMGSDRTGEVRALASLLGRDTAQAVETFQKESSGTPYRSVRVLENLSEVEVARFEVDRDLFPGASLHISPRRFYPFGGTAAHLLGYVGEISRSQLTAGAHPGARQGDVVGKYGLERFYDEYLRGQDGGRQVEVDAVGREIAVLGITEPVPGSNMVLALDIRIQQELEAALGTNSGAGVMLDVRTGEVLALASAPAFDPNEFSLRMPRERWNSFINDPSHPLQNRAIQGNYPPGSTFKVVTGLAALMDGVIGTDDAINCLGSYTFGRRAYRDWKPRGHGRVDFFRSIVESCDVYYYKAGEKAGIDSLARWGAELGLGDRTGIDLPGESPGLLPSTAWKLRDRKEPWFPGETLSAAIGQGYVLVTPVQLANAYASVARRGTVLPPRLVSRIERSEEGKALRTTADVGRVSPVRPEVWSALVAALEGVVSEEHGTGRAAMIKGIAVAGKTGTAQVVRLQDTQDLPEDQIPIELRDHAWFAAFAPAQDPRVAAAVVVEHGGHGASAAAPVVARMFRKYFELAEQDAAGVPVIASPAGTAGPWRAAAAEDSPVTVRRSVTVAQETSAGPTEPAGAPVTAPRSMTDGPVVKAATAATAEQEETAEEAR